ncbi:hypothetical protein BGW42_003494 [Actinomortierella wolfii]|nr:hypothetical protein BGW42_003494 [Actinomortierella wolfii]
MSSESSTGLSAANSDHDHPMANDATSATTSATTSASDPNLRGSTNDSSVDVSATSATEFEIKQESLTTLATLPLPSQTSQPPSSPPAAVKKEEDGNVDELADKSKDADASGAPTSAPSEQTLLVLPPASLQPELTPKPDPDAHATDLAQPVSNTNVDADGDITMKNEPPMGTFDVAMQIDPVSAAADADAEAAAVVAAVVATGLPAVLTVPDTVAGISLAEVPPIPMVGVPNNEGEQEQLLSPSPSPQRVDSPSQQQQQQQQDRRSSHSPSSSSSSLKPTAGDTKPRSKSFDATAASAAIATATSSDVTSSTTSSSTAAGSSSSTTTTGKAPRVRKGAPPSEKKPLKVYPPRKQRSRVNWDEAKVPPESPLSTLASAAVAVSTLSAATAITPASTMPITPTVSATNGGSVTAVSGVTSTSTAGGSAGGAVTVTTHHVVPDDATLQALSKARAQLAAEGGGYRCELCPGERFGRVHDLKRHHISKHNEMTWPCDFCHRPFVRRDALLRHYTVKAARNDGVHPTQDEPERLSEARARAKLLS